jgi:adenylate cyclase
MTREPLPRSKAHRKEVIDPKVSEHHGRIFKTARDNLLEKFASMVDAAERANWVR